MNTQVGVLAHGTYTLKITDPILFLKGFVPAEYYSGGGEVFDFADYENSAAEQLFNEVVGSLAGAFSAYTNDIDKQNRIMNIQRDSVGFAQSLAQTVENNYHWQHDRGLQIVKAAIVSIDYDKNTKELMSKVKQADALMGARGNVNFQASFAKGIEAAGENPEGGALGMGFLGMGIQGVSGTVGAMQQPIQQQTFTQPEPPTSASAPTSEDPYEKLSKLKGLLDQGIISQEDFDAAKLKLLDI
jgi:membrane protease subunit (stomatin/prohibitin family)